jgi:hypothetical protein
VVALTFEDLEQELKDPRTPEERKQEIREAKAERLQLINEQGIGDVQWLMSSETGRRNANTWLRWTMPMANCNGQLDEGRARVGRQLMEYLLEHCPKEFLLMKQEANDFRDRCNRIGAGFREDSRS